jgi:hypothetical protein
MVDSALGSLGSAITVSVVSFASVAARVCERACVRDRVLPRGELARVARARDLLEQLPK